MKLQQLGLKPDEMKQLVEGAKFAYGNQLPETQPLTDIPLPKYSKARQKGLNIKLPRHAK